jgi:hypothetical protein
MQRQSFTSPATTSSPFVHVDERALILCDGRSTVMFEQARRRWVAETLDILLFEGRATRTQRDRTLIGVSLSLPTDTVRDLRAALD